MRFSSSLRRAVAGLLAACLMLLSAGVRAAEPAATAPDESAVVEGMSEQLVLPVGHSAMLVSYRVAEAVAAFLEGGHFAAGCR